MLDEPAIPKASPKAVPAVARVRRVLSLKFWLWMVVPSNLLSLLAIVAVIVVPAIDKFLKADIELRAKTDSLLDITTKLVKLNYGFDSRDLKAGTDEALDKSGLLMAEKHINLGRALDIAEDIKHDVEPSILFALASECLSFGEIDRARDLLGEVLRRQRPWSRHKPSPEEVMRAHVLLAQLVVEEARNISRSTSANAAYKKQMTLALTPYATGQNNFAKTQRAYLLGVWADLDDKMGDSKSAGQHRQEALRVALSLPERNPLLEGRIRGGAATASSATLSMEAFPQSRFYEKSYVTYQGTQMMGILMKSPGVSLEAFAGEGYPALLYIYQEGKFLEAFEAYSARTSVSNEVGATLEIQWVRTVPFFPEFKPMVEAVWLVRRKR